MQDISTEMMTTEATEGISEYQFYLNVVHQMLGLLFSMDIGWGADCEYWARNWIKVYQAEQNTWIPYYLAPLLITICRCWVRQIYCDFYGWQLTEEQIALFDKLNLLEERLAQAFNARRDEYIAISVFYCSGFLFGVTGEYDYDFNCISAVLMMLIIVYISLLIVYISLF